MRLRRWLRFKHKVRRLGIIVASTRPTRVGHLIGQWVHERAVEHGKFDIELLDLAKFHLPL